MLKYLLSILFIITFSCIFAQNSLIIRFEKIIETKGNLLIYIYNKPDGFPKEKNKVYRREITGINHTKEVKIDGLAFGSYAIIVVIDKNRNKMMDRNWLGLPAEPYALSGHPKFRFGPPRFDDVKFNFTQNKQVVNLQF